MSHAVSESTPDTPVASADVVLQHHAIDGSGMEDAFEMAGGEPMGEETFETRVGIVEPVEEDEAEVT